MNDKIKMIQTKKVLTGLLEIKKVIARESPRNYGLVFLFDGDESGNRIVGTDGYRLVKHEIGEMPTELIGVAFNYDQMLMLIQLLRNEPACFAVPLDENDVEVEFQGRSTTIKLRKSMVKYPNYQAVMPNKFDLATKHTIEKYEIKEFTQAVKDAVAQADRSKVVDILGDGILVNGKFLLDAITGNSKVTIEWKNKDEPIVITKGDSIKGKTETILVPVKKGIKK
jgi:DNA polymerase III sliding clamp (beta) subunit (PCNA family)